jgi:hypothetical protein
MLVTPINQVKLNVWPKSANVSLVAAMKPQLRRRIASPREREKLLACSQAI